MVIFGWNGVISVNMMKFDKLRSVNVYVMRCERVFISGLGVEEEGERGERCGNDEFEVCRGEGGEVG